MRPGRYGSNTSWSQQPTHLSSTTQRRGALWKLTHPLGEFCLFLSLHGSISAVEKLLYDATGTPTRYIPNEKAFTPMNRISYMLLLCISRLRFAQRSTSTRLHIHCVYIPGKRLHEVQHRADNKVSNAKHQAPNPFPPFRIFSSIVVNYRMWSFQR